MAKTAVVLTRDTGGHQLSWGTAFVAGLRRHGWQAEIVTEWRLADLFVMWGTRRSDKIARTKAAGAEVCIIERGYVGNRFNWSSVSFGGGLNGRGEFRGPVDDPSRWQTHFARLMQPWRVSEGPVTIFGQVPADMSVKGVDLTRFYQQAYDAFSKLGHEVWFRPHPQGSRGAYAPQGARLVSAGRPIGDVLSQTAVAVTWNSNSGVDAVLAGVPTVALDEGSMAWAVAGHELAVPPTPDRAAWAARIAWCQWTKDEMASGECWAAVGG